VEPFEGQPMVTLEAVLADPRAVTLLPADAALPQLPPLALDAEGVRRLQQGQRLPLGAAAPTPGRCRIYGPGGRFLGVGEVNPGGVLQPRRLFNDLGPQST